MLDVALEMSGLPEAKLQGKLLDPAALTKGGIGAGGGGRRRLKRNAPA